MVWLREDIRQELMFKGKGKGKDPEELWMLWMAPILKGKGKGDSKGEDEGKGKGYDNKRKWWQPNYDEYTEEKKEEMRLANIRKGVQDGRQLVDEGLYEGTITKVIKSKTDERGIHRYGWIRPKKPDGLPDIVKVKMQEHIYKVEAKSQEKQRPVTFEGGLLYFRIGDVEGFPDVQPMKDMLVLFQVYIDNSGNSGACNILPVDSHVSETP
mmetsp:Transcript_41581/g.76004  ORF Transcript_41581/g.76004 Transcript_41581/m.76004 type:complete len:211 (+) Transcript_41581:78-710(+)